MRIWSVLLVLFMFVFSACATEEKPRLTEEEQEWADEALATADEMYSLRQDSVLDESTREALKQMYLEYVYTRNNTRRTEVHYLPNRMKTAQKFLGGVSDYELDRAWVDMRGDSVEVRLRLKVYGNKHDTTEWVKLRQRPDDEDWMRDNEGDFVIVSHQIRM